MRFYSPFTSQRRLNARSSLQGARQICGDGRPGGVGWAAEPKSLRVVASPARGVGGFLAAKGKPPGPQPGVFPFSASASLRSAFTGEPLVPPWAPSFRLVGRFAGVSGAGGWWYCSGGSWVGEPPGRSSPPPAAERGDLRERFGL